ncbi:MAG: hypothetical protein ACOY90_06580 [Candidatus Zhuqueibacterota bacterium]
MSFKKATVVFLLMLLLISFFSCEEIDSERLDERLETVVEFKPIREHTGDEDINIAIQLRSNIGHPSARLVYKIDGVIGEPVNLSPLGEGVYGYTIPAQDRGTRMSYYIEVTTATGAKMYLPKNAPEKEKYYTLTFKGKANSYFLFLYIVLTVGAMLLFIAATWSALKFFQNQIEVDRAVWLSFAAYVLFFISIIPIGIIVEYQVVGSIYQGWPFGHDFSDTKTILLLIYWFVCLTMVKNKIAQNEEKDFMGDRGFAALVMIGGIVTVILSLIQHDNFWF